MRNLLPPQRLTVTTLARRRTGAVLVSVLACLVVTTAIAALTVRQSLEARRQGRVERQLRQTQYLLDAGIRRAAERLRADASYSGETWQPTVALARFGDVRVEIRVTTVEGEDAVDNNAVETDAAREDTSADGTRPAATERQVEITARLGPGESAAHATQLSYRFPISTAPEPDPLSAAE